MTPLDQVLIELAHDVDTLSRRSQAALFWTCTSALRDQYVIWAEATQLGRLDLLDASLAAARAAVLEGAAPSAEVLGELEAHVTPGEAIGNVPGAYAQDCWICADVALQVLIDDQYAAGKSIEYALTPKITEVTERLFGVSQIGSGSDEVPQTEAILADPDIRAAIEFCRWAISALTGDDLLTKDGLEMLRQKATVLSPA